MAVTVRDVCTKAFRKLGVLRAGGEMRTADAEDARSSLQSFLMECVTAGTFGRVRDVLVSQPATLTAGENQHVNVTATGTVTVDLPTTVAADYWAYCNPVGDYGWPLNEAAYYSSEVRAPKDRSVIMVTNKDLPERPAYVFDGTIQRWMRIDTLTLNDEAPLSARNSDGLASVLAVRLADEFGASLLSPGTVQAATRYKTALVLHYGAGEDCYC